MYGHSLKLLDMTNSYGQAVFVYGVLFMDWGTEKTPFQGVSLDLYQKATVGCLAVRFAPGSTNRQTRFGQRAPYLTPCLTQMKSTYRPHLRIPMPLSQGSVLIVFDNVRSLGFSGHVTTNLLSTIKMATIQVA